MSAGSGPLIRALVSADGRLLRADGALLTLNARAGGALGEPLAHTPLAALARLAARLGVALSRAVTLADCDEDVVVDVRAVPGPEGVALEMEEWQAHEPQPPISAEAAPPSAAEQWATDDAMRITAIATSLAQDLGLDAAKLTAKPLTEAFHLLESEVGGLPILTAIAMRRAFSGQRAALRDGGAQVVLAGEPRLAADGQFAGYSGSIELAAPPHVAPGMPTGFARRLDQVLRAPLGRIVASADAISAQADGPLRADYADYAADIASAGRHLIALVDDLADLSAIERPDFAVPVEPVDLADVARRAAGLLAVRAADSGVRIDRPAPDDMVPVTGEFHRALQVLVNLIGNAVRYSPPGGMVWVRAEQEEGFGIIIVADQGKGIALEDQERIFERFVRVDRSESGGSGLGLYIARRLARAMGGDVTVDSAPGQGARFVFGLPMAR